MSSKGQVLQELLKWIFFVVAGQSDNTIPDVKHCTIHKWQRPSRERQCIASHHCHVGLRKNLLPDLLKERKQCNIAVEVSGDPYKMSSTHGSVISPGRRGREISKRILSAIKNRCLFCLDCRTYIYLLLLYIFIYL